MTDPTTVIGVAVFFGLTGAVAFAAMWFSVIASRLESKVVWSDDATLRGKLSIYRMHISEREDWGMLLYNLRNGFVLGFVSGVFGSLFAVGFTEVFL